MVLLRIVWNFLRYNFLFLIVIILFYNQCSAQAKVPDQPTQSITTSENNRISTYTFKELGEIKSLTLNGYKPNYTIYLPIAKYVNPQKAVLHLKIAFSPALSEESHLDIKFNDVPLRRLTLPANVNQEINLDIELPLTQLSPDWQALSFAASLSSTKSLCNPDNWIYISPESSLTLTTLELPFQGTLNQLLPLFFSPIAVHPIPIMLLLPQNAVSQEIFSLLHIAFQVGQIAGDSKVNLIADVINEAKEKQTESNLILISTQEHLLKETDLQLNELTSTQNIKNALNNNAGIILLKQSPFNPMRGLLIITGRDYSALAKAISAFLTPEFNQLSSGTEAFINKVQVLKNSPPIGDWYKSSLTELGYSDQSVSGLGRHQLSYTIPLPNDRIPTNASVKTLITAPPYTLKDHSQITLLLNGAKQSSFKLTQENSAWNAQISASAMKPGINKLDYLIDLHLEDENCSVENYNEVWATIHAETEFSTLFRSNPPQAMLNQFPVPFSSELTLIVPDQLSKQDINNLTQLLFKLGQLTQPNPLSVNFLTASETNEDFIRHQNIILYGTNDNNSWIKFAYGYLPVQLKGNSRSFNSSQKEIQFSGARSTGLLELVPSPWSEDHSVFLITGDNETALSQTIAKFIDDKTRMELRGNIAFVNFDQSVELLKSDDVRYFSFTHQILRYVTNFGKNILYYVETHPQVFIYLLVFIVPLYIFLRRRKK